MATKKQWVTFGKRKLEISNLEKVLFPDDHIVKAEVIQYYTQVAPLLLQHTGGRPLTLIRFPDGISGESFYQKNRPDWSPDWIEFITLGTEEKKDYILANEAATFVWLANLASIELHQMHCRTPLYDNPDYMVFDLDPPEGYRFVDVVDIAQSLKMHIESYGYTPFVKTTGGKGVHVVVPLVPQADFNQVFDAAQQVAKPFVETHAKTCTLHIKKDARKGRVLIDIYRNRRSQTIVSPYSLRGRVHAPVSMPVSWEMLASTNSPEQFTLHTVPELIQSHGDAWDGMDAYAVALHTQRSTTVAVTLPKSGKRKTKEQLQDYAAKRDFSKTQEPHPEVELPGGGNNFVVHRHHASHIHYDLRLEEDGVLKSWAVPKGLPPVPGVKRLAVQTEDHPLAYLTFDGEIPKGEYGGGIMWIFTSGKYTVTKRKKDGSFYFRLNSAGWSGAYRMYKMKEKEWLLERVDDVINNWLKDPVDFMLATASNKLPTASSFLYEVKWDGIRAMITIEDGVVTIRSRNLRDITAQFPELTEASWFRGANAVLDAELVCLDENGKPDFRAVIHRLMNKRVGKTTKHRVYAYVFDVLYMDGKPVVNEPLWRRRAWLRDSIKVNDIYRVSESVEDGKALLQAAKEHELEGIMAKDSNSKYYPGKRSAYWLKIKIRNTMDCVVIGYTQGNGNRENTFGALQLAEYMDGVLKYRGRVGTGFTDNMMLDIRKMLDKLKNITKPIDKSVLDEKITTWVEPYYYVEVSYSAITKDKMLREPVFVRIREDLSM